MKEVKTLKLKYGEYYSLKITDSSAGSIFVADIQERKRRQGAGGGADERRSTAVGA